jgi:hypothetical protein
MFPAAKERVWHAIADNLKFPRKKRSRRKSPTAQQVEPNAITQKDCQYKFINQTESSVLRAFMMSSSVFPKKGYMNVLGSKIPILNEDSSAHSFQMVHVLPINIPSLKH